MKTGPFEKRQYQVDAVFRLRPRLRELRRALLVAPTGSGKTVIAAFIVLLARRKSSRVVFFAHRRELIHQTHRKLLHAGIPAEDVGVMMADDPLANPDAPVQVVSIDTWRHRTPPPADLVIIDEAHRSLGETYMRAIKHYSQQGAVVLGMTATPFRGDGRGLGDIYEVMEVVASPRQLISMGHLVEPRVFSAPPDVRPDLSRVRVKAGDYVESDLGDAMNQAKLVGGIVDHWQRHAEGRRTVVFAVNVAHSRAITSAFNAAGIPAEHIDAFTPKRERDAVLARVESGETLVVCNCGVLCEGWDQPSVKCAILARPTKSEGLYLQQAGRILRPWQGVTALILDHAGNALVHGLPQDDRVFELTKTKAREAGDAPTKECPECHAIVSAASQTCPECDYEFEPPKDPEADPSKDLVEVKPIPTEELRAAWQSLVDTWHRINEERLTWGRRPMKPGWVWYKFRDRYQRNPPSDCKKPYEIATPAEKDEALAELRRTRLERGYKEAWVLHRFHERFGHAPGEEPTE